MLNKKISRSLQKKKLENNIVKVAAPRFISSMYVNRLKLRQILFQEAMVLKNLLILYLTVHCFYLKFLLNNTAQVQHACIHFFFFIY